MKQRGQMVDKTGTIDTAMIIQLAVKGSLIIKLKRNGNFINTSDNRRFNQNRQSTMKIDFQTAPNRSLLKGKG